MECSICMLDLNTETPTITLLCNHKFHTRCLITDMYRFMRQEGRPLTLCMCPLCEAYIVPNEIVEGHNIEQREVELENRTTKFLWETEPAFKNGIISIKDYVKNVTITERKMLRAAQSIKAVFKEAITPARRVIEEAKANALKQLHALVEYKNYTAALGASKKNTNKFRNTWGINLWNLRSALHDIPDAIRIIPQRFHYFNRTRWMFKLRV